MEDRRLNHKTDDEEYNLSDPTWVDDTLDTGIGDIDGSDPSMKGYNKGWNMDPYQQRYYAKRFCRLQKNANREVYKIDYNADNLAQQILTYWNETNGTLQDCFNGFTMNRMSNELKQQIADIINEQGYKIYPKLDDRKNRYASNKKKD